MIPSSSLIPKSDPSLLFTNAGMVQFKEYFLGKASPFTSATSVQKCIRAGGKHNDLENVGYTPRHHTFFEMLGNFSFGGYFKEEAIKMSWDLLTKVFAIDKSKLYITVYHNDDEAYNIWRKVSGFDHTRIIKIATQDNFWSMGDLGPCGPCSEIFYDYGPQYKSGFLASNEDTGLRYVEIWNLVFMQYEKLQDSRLINLPKQSVDTGMGLERVAAVLQNCYDNYSTDLFQNIINDLIDVYPKSKYNKQHSYRIIADHARSIAFLIADGLQISNEGRGYVLRRIIRRAMRHVYDFGRSYSLRDAALSVIYNMKHAYPELTNKQETILEQISLEEEKFSCVFDHGMSLLHKYISQCQDAEFDGAIAFELYDTYGFPLDITEDILREHNMTLNKKRFDEAMEEQKKRGKLACNMNHDDKKSVLWFDLLNKYGATDFTGYDQLACDNCTIVSIIRCNAEVKEAAEGEDVIVLLNRTPFYAESGGQVGDTGYIGTHYVYDTKKYGEQLFGHHVVLQQSISVGDIFSASVDTNKRRRIAANHSATHLLHLSLRSHLRDNVTQKGSYLDDKKLRFDFIYHKKIDHRDVNDIEQHVNEMIMQNLQCESIITDYNAAIDGGAMALFDEKYDDNVRMVTMGQSKELCGGTHVKRTGEIGTFKIISDKSIASGIRRIEAYTGDAAITYCNNQITICNEITNRLKCQDHDILTKIEELINNGKTYLHEISQLKIEALIYSQDTIKQIANEEKIIIINCNRFYAEDHGQLRSLVSMCIKNHAKSCIAFATNSQNSSTIVVQIDKQDSKILKANEITQYITSSINGKGGGNANIAQIGSVSLENDEQLVNMIRNKFN